MRLLFLIFLPGLLQAQTHELDAAAGKALFERNWIPAPASTASADGLGPYYNARSCAACHRGGGAGDMDLAHLNVVIDDPYYGQGLQTRALAGLVPEAGMDLTEGLWAYVDMADGSQVELQQGLLTVNGAAALQSPVSLRRAPSLFGLAALETVADSRIEAFADPDDNDGDGISGRVPGGRFGWKAQGVSLREQVGRALSLDLGLGNPVFPDPAGDCTTAQTACQAAARASNGDELEVGEVALELLLRYLETLAPPASRSTADEEGAVLFTALGCAACHRPDLDAAGHRPWSDLLLHDMGPALADAPSPGLASEWRTAPLWGLRQSERYLHDGRARTVEEAILWHGGEGDASAEAFRALNQAARRLLLEWLLGL